MSIATSIALTLEEGIAYLCRPTVGNFYAYIFNSLERVFTTSIPTFCVGPQGTRYVMQINPVFMSKQPFNRIVMIIEHEITHIILNHVPRGMRMYALCDSPESRRYFFIAKPISADAAVNELVRQNHPMEVMKPEMVTEEDKKYRYPAVLAEDWDLPRNQTYEEYTALLMEQLRKKLPDPESVIKKVLEQLQAQIEAAGGAQPGSIIATIQAEMRGSGEPEGSNDPKLEDQLVQSLLDSIGEHLAEYVQDQTDPAAGRHLEEHGKAVVRASARSYAKLRGTLPAGLKELVEAFLRAPTVSWTEILNNLVQVAEKSKPVRGMRRVSKMRAAMVKHLSKTNAKMRRLPLFPGTERDPKFIVWYVRDTSGSMSQDDLALGLAELQHIQKAARDMEIWVLDVDMSIARVYTIGPEDKIRYDAFGRGGTDFEVAISYIAKEAEHVDIVVYQTDGYAPAPTTRLAAPIIWLITPTGKRVVPEGPGHITLEMRPYSAGEAA